jgi:hypothetical protein
LKWAIEPSSLIFDATMHDTAKFPGIKPDVAITSLMFSVIRQYRHEGMYTLKWRSVRVWLLIWYFVEIDELWQQVTVPEAIMTHEPEVQAESTNGQLVLHCPGASDESNESGLSTHKWQLPDMNWRGQLFEPTLERQQVNQCV